MLKRSRTEEERAAHQAEKARRQEESSLRKAADAEKARLQRETHARETSRQEFFRSPAGEARVAFERGDKVFQFMFDLAESRPVVVPMAGAYTSKRTQDPTMILNSVCNEGWELVNGSFVFHELGSESRDKFLASGQHVAVKGTVVGFYLFRRADSNLTQAVNPWDVHGLKRHCPHCGVEIDALAEVCVGCGRRSEPWHQQGERWWQHIDGKWYLLDPATGEWIERGQDEAAEDAGAVVADTASETT